jgi:RNAse (barnase) inhibitor barstar
MLQAVSNKSHFVIDSAGHCGYDSRIGYRIIIRRILAMSSQASRQIQKLLSKGGAFEPAESAAVLQQAAADAEIAWCVADCGKARNRSAFFRAVVKAVDYPQFFGSRFDGLYDCLCDSVNDQKAGMVLLFDQLHSSDPALEGDMDELTQILDDVVSHASDQGKVFIYGINHSGKHPDDTPGVVRNWSDATD